ncbi:MAG: hypothetical protein AAGE59_34265 [Cyanobacteria bacterium P01_F01_bin.86]
MSYVQIQTSYLVIEPELWDKKFQVALGMQGGTQTGFVNKIIEDFFRHNLDYYLEAARLDAEARGYDSFQGAYYRDLLSNDLNPWTDGLRPDFQNSPLKRITDAKEARKNQHRLKQIRVSEYNAALIRLTMEIDDLTLIQLTSRIMVWHLHQYWDVKGGYQWQIAGSKQETLEPEI